MRPLRRGDIGVIAFSLAMIVPTTLGGAAFLWFACARYGMGSLGVLAAIAWTYWTGRILVRVVREFLEPEPPSVGAFRELRRSNPAVGKFFCEKEARR